ncbi:MAG: SUMF1/EgtB/PvdO family nonheme iron enzyme [Minicystis sp.]
MVSVRTAVGLVVGTVAVFFTGVYAARAKEGGATKNALSFAGTLTGVDASQAQTLTFDFKKAGASACAVPPKVAGVMVDLVTHGFRAEIPLDGCPATLFDGGDVTLEISVDGVAGVLATGPVNPVPYAKYADQVGSPDCPVGYGRVGAGAPIVCAQGVDEVVKVGVGASAFWIDRYEASIWDKADGTGTQFGLIGGDAKGVGFHQNGQHDATFVPLFATSKPGVLPSTLLTWFQVNEACRLSGKRLPSSDEWLTAASGTPDPAMPNSGLINGECVTGNGAGGPRLTAGANVVSQTACVSAYGAQDMIGNVAEWTVEWFAGLYDDGIIHAPHIWPSDGNLKFAGDSVNNVSSYVELGEFGPTQGFPAAAVHGGAWLGGTGAGVFALDLANGPTDLGPSKGFRCVLPR